MKTYLVTGGTGFIGSALVRALVLSGAKVRCLDNNVRGSLERLEDVADAVEMRIGDIRDPQFVRRAVRGVDSVLHLAYINGTEFFYSRPELVLEVGVKGMMNVLDACIAESVSELVLASSSEVYQTPPRTPTDESVPLCVPDPHNPRYSYGGGKIISELLAINYGRKFFQRVLVFRPHNVYGPNMGWEHVIPQLSLRLRQMSGGRAGHVQLAIQGSGQETRAFVFIDDFITGLMTVLERGEHLQIYHLGTEEEVTIAGLARQIGQTMGCEVDVLPSKALEGGTPRRCPDTRRVRALGYEPRFSLKEGLAQTVPWYWENWHKQPVLKGVLNDRKAA